MSSIPLSMLRSRDFFSLDAAIWTTSEPRSPARLPETTRELKAVTLPENPERRAATPEVGRAEHAEVTDIMAAIVTVPRIDVSEATDVCTRLSLCRVFRTSTSQSYKSLFSRISSAGAFRGGRKSMNLTLHDR